VIVFRSIGSAGDGQIGMKAATSTILGAWGERQ
jgi:hypothetical protein